MPAIHHDAPPDAPAPTTPTGGLELLDEWRTGIEVLRLGRHARRLSDAPRGSGPVVVFPGWRAPELSMEPLRAWLASLGYDAHHWGLGVNQGDVEGDRDRVLPLLDRLGPRVQLVGWSLGGVVARELSRVRPVARVVTFGSPVVGGPTYTIAGAGWSAERVAQALVHPKVVAREAPIQVPLTVVFSRRDRVVDWPACLDRRSPRAAHVEVESTHVGMGLDPEVWLTVASALAQG